MMSSHSSFSHFAKNDSWEIQSKNTYKTSNHEQEKKLRYKYIIIFVDEMAMGAPAI